MNKTENTQISRRLSYILRHNPKSVGLELETNGWIQVTDLLVALETHGNPVELSALEEVVESNSKQRFEFDESHKRIRARQGHSIAVDLGYVPKEPPPLLYHGTATRFLDSILKNGLEKRNRQHVHLSTNQATMVEVAKRHGKPALLEIDASSMHRNGYQFYLTENHVWLTDRVPPDYLSLLAE